MLGNELIANKAYATYFVKFTIIDPISTPDVEELYFAETYICDTDSPISVTKIHTDPSVNKFFKRRNG